MPTYEYKCAKCGEHFDIYQSFSDAPLTKHKGCGGKVAKVLSPAGIVLKGSGFYKNDSRSSSRSTSTKVDKSESSASTAASGGSSESSSSSTSSTTKSEPDSKSA